MRKRVGDADGSYDLIAKVEAQEHAQVPYIIRVIGIR